MRIIDTHAHLYAEEFSQDLTEVIQRAKKTGVEKILLPNIDTESISLLKKTAEDFSDFFLPMMGLHPTSVGDDWKSQLDTIKKELDNNTYIAIGEIGIDLYWDKTFKNQQILAFEEQLNWSIEKDLPVAIHSRDAISEVIQSIKNVGENKLRGVFHSFGGNEDELKAVLEFKNFYLGINGVVTFKNSGLAETLKKCPLDRIIVETDSPYLAPVPYRGKRNESSYLTYVLTKLSEIYNKDESDIAEVTTENAKKLFKFS